MADINHLTESIIGCAIEVHRQLGPGLLEGTYEEAHCIELADAGWKFQRQLMVPVLYKGRKIGEYRLDLLVEDLVVVEIKSVERFDPIFEAQVLTYLRVTGKKVGLLINFNIQAPERRPQAFRSVVIVLCASVPLWLHNLREDFSLMIPHTRFARSRREFISESAAGFGGLALSFLLQQDLLRADASRIVSPLAPKKPPLPAKAKSVIFLFQAGGPSQMDTFDPKPLLNQLEGQPLPKSFGPIRSQFLKENARILGTRRTFKKHGQSGIEVSDLFPHMAQCVDDMAIIRSCYCDIIVHSAAQYQMMSGRLVPGFPSMGSWVIYGLGSESHSLPAYVVMPAPEGALEGGQPMYGQGFLPAAFQPTMMRPGANPILNLDLPKGVSREQRRRTIDLIRDLGQASMAPDDNQVSARLASYELAFQMQTDAPEVVDIAHETRETKDLYGIGTQPSDDYGRRCLLARRMVEKGVRFVCVVAGGGPGELQWDAHSDIEENHHRLAAQTDKPVAGLLKDLKRRGLLDSTLVVWGGEFGRTALAEGRDPNALGRDHSPTGFTWWMAGGGIKGGTVVGATDDLGIHAVTDRIHFRDLHTTILNQLGLDQNQLTYLHLGREERLTELHGTVIEKIIA